MDIQLRSKERQARLSSKAGVRRISRLSHEYLEFRNQHVEREGVPAEMAAAVRRSELIEKRLVTAQAQYLFVAMRQKILNLPQTYSRRLVGLNDREIAQVLQEAAHSILNEIRDLPNTVSDPHWLEEVGGGRGEVGTPIANLRDLPKPSPFLLFPILTNCALHQSELKMEARGHKRDFALLQPLDERLDSLPNSHFPA